jgi:hypothetical protein
MASLNFRRVSGSRLQCDSYAADYNSAVAASDAVRHLFQSFSGNLPDLSTSPPGVGVHVQGCMVVRDMDMPAEAEGVKGPAYRRLLEIEFQYSE